ncbi:ATP-binding cassette domain-containing protein [Haloimpatiens sp. FM7330]|uniref:ABC transporter ATP-binding protein n=1 Tax=Haloimpatiens sp. FM7330 TaxID=3298610 RepID=UPI00362B1600
MTLIQFKDINLKFKDKIIFDNFNMDVLKGEKIVLNAPSGKGKSTLFKLLLGFQKIDRGTILFNNKILEKKTLVYFRKNIGYVSQDVDFKNGKIGDLIDEIFSYNCNKHIKITKEQITHLVEYFNLPKDTLEKEVKQLSGGERQRLGLIICILLDRPVWLLDEVTSGLDKYMKEKVVNYVLKQDKTVLIISHDKIWTENNLVRVEEW